MSMVTCIAAAVLCLISSGTFGMAPVPTFVGSYVIARLFWKQKLYKRRHFVSRPQPQYFIVAISRSMPSWSANHIAWAGLIARHCREKPAGRIIHFVTPVGRNEIPPKALQRTHDRETMFAKRWRGSINVHRLPTQISAEPTAYSSAPFSKHLSTKKAHVVQANGLACAGGVALVYVISLVSIYMYLEFSGQREGSRFQV